MVLTKLVCERSCRPPAAVQLQAILMHLPPVAVQLQEPLSWEVHFTVSHFLAYVTNLKSTSILF